MIDHISVGVRDLERAARFYEAVLAALGLARLVTRPATIGFGKNYPEFWINLRATMAQVSPESGSHMCLRAKSTAEVDEFHAAALKAGGLSNRIEAVTFPEA
jgi:catechol 2,3-dioxygenase-like lactoylglutathione lyase family enzyme